jgi:hypothetical protein
VSDGYKVRREHDCIVIEGWIPVTDLVALTREWDKTRGDGEAAWIVDSLLASHLQVNMVLGTPQACLAWRQQLGIAVPDSAARPRYRLVDQPYPGIVCGKCGMTSYNRNDITHRYCGNCNIYLDNT